MPLACLQRHVKHPEASRAEICKIDGRALPCDENGTPHPQRTTVSPFTLRGQILCKIPMRLRILPQYHPSFLGVLHVVFCRLLQNPVAPIACKKRDDAFTRSLSGSIVNSLDGRDIIDVNQIEHACLVSEPWRIIQVGLCQYGAKSGASLNIRYYKPCITYLSNQLVSWIRGTDGSKTYVR